MQSVDCLFSLVVSAAEINLCWRVYFCGGKKDGKTKTKKKKDTKNGGKMQEINRQL